MEWIKRFLEWCSKADHYPNVPTGKVKREKDKEDEDYWKEMKEWAQRNRIFER
jgi:hypothetical protein